jgi:hypothetical protein
MRGKDRRRNALKMTNECCGEGILCNEIKSKKSAPELPKTQDDLEKYLESVSFKKKRNIPKDNIKFIL